MLVLLGSSILSSSANAQNFALRMAAPGMIGGDNPNLPQGNTPRTIEAWVKTTSTENQTVFSYGNFSPNQRSGLLLIRRHVYFVGQNNDVEGSVTIPLDTWTHVAVTYDGVLVRLYVDGVLDVEAQLPAGDHNATGFAWTIGQTPANEPYVGLLDEIRVWNVVRSASEIEANRFACVTGEEQTLVANYRIDDATLGLPLDRSCSNANATFRNPENPFLYIFSSDVPLVCPDFFADSFECEAGPG
jgi:hypothetical protein